MVAKLYEYMSLTQLNSLMAVGSASSRACMAAQAGMSCRKSEPPMSCGALPVCGTAAGSASGRYFLVMGAAVGESGTMYPKWKPSAWPGGGREVREIARTNR